MSKRDLSADINFLFEMGNLRFIDRMWTRLFRDNIANIAEHHFRTFWIAMIIAAHEGDVDTGKIAKLVLVHDIAESRTGEVDFISRQYVTRHEESAMKDMLAGTAIEKEFFDLWAEYEARETLEAKIAKDADNLDVDFELSEQASRGSRVGDVKKPTREHVAKTKLYTKTAKAMYEQLKATDPHDWWWQSPGNRFKSGDWSK